MGAKQKLKESIIHKVEKLTDDQLSNLNIYLDDLGNEFSTEQNSLSFSGIFKELEIEDLTSKLHESRMYGKDRIPQF